MFTVKFMTVFNDGTSSQTSISCPNYSVYKREKSYTVTTYPTFTDTNGVDRHVCEIEQITSDSAPPPIGSFTSCYVENEKGKTIESLHSNDFQGDSKGRSIFPA